MKKQRNTNTTTQNQVAEHVGKLLLRRCETIAVAESVTAGLVQHRLAAVENASLFFQGGITAYNLGQKARHLQIDPIHALGCNCVSGKVATEMAVSICQLFHSDWGLAVTGYAVPAPESDNKLFAFIAVARRGKLLEARKVIPPHSDPARVQQHYLSVLIRTALQQIKKAAET